MNLKFLRKVRTLEAQKILRYLPNKAQILEIGAGAGWQAKFFSSMGYEVSAIDLISSNYASVKDYSISNYDGINIPFPNSSFDVAFSSNVIEHIEDQKKAFSEMLRVLRPGGISIHIVPSSSWRFWTSVAHYPAMIKEVLSRLKYSETTYSSPPAGARPRRSLINRIFRFLISPRHGEHGSAFLELKLFSKNNWVDLFETAGFAKVEIHPLNIFYSGQTVLGDFLPISLRTKLANICGSSTLVVMGIKLQ